MSWSVYRGRLRWALGTGAPQHRESPLSTGSSSRWAPPELCAGEAPDPAHSLEYTHAGSFTELNVQILKLFSKMAQDRDSCNFLNRTWNFPELWKHLQAALGVRFPQSLSHFLCLIQWVG